MKERTNERNQGGMGGRRVGKTIVGQDGRDGCREAGRQEGASKRRTAGMEAGRPNGAKGVKKGIMM